MFSKHELVDIQCSTWNIRIIIRFRWRNTIELVEHRQYWILILCVDKLIADGQRVIPYFHDPQRSVGVDRVHPEGGGVRVGAVGADGLGALLLVGRAALAARALGGGIRHCHFIPLVQTAVPHHVYRHIHHLERLRAARGCHDRAIGVWRRARLPPKFNQIAMVQLYPCFGIFRSSHTVNRILPWTPAYACKSYCWTKETVITVFIP